MLNALKFVRGAVAKKDLVPSLTHFRIENRTIKGYNGALALSCPINLDFAVSPRAAPFVAAMQACTETVQLHMMQSGRLSVKSGGFKAFIECSEEPFPDVYPEGAGVPCADFGVLAILRKLLPFIADDASRPWARGILLREQSAFATNNIVVIEYWHGYAFPYPVNIPRMAVVELLRIGEEPERLSIAADSITFHFSGQRWLRTQTFPTDWPDLSRVLDKPSVQKPVPPALWAAVKKLAPFVDDAGRLFLSPGKLSTASEDGAGASVDVAGIEADARLNLRYLAQLEGVATNIDLSCYPAPCLFTGERLRGAIAGMRS